MDRRNLLPVEDNSDTRRAISLLLRSSGFTVRTAGSVGEAFAAMADERFDVLVSDFGLPDGSGPDTMRRGLDQVGLKGIAFSGYGSPDDVRASMEAGFSHHMIKPASLNDLVAVIRGMAS